MSPKAIDLVGKKNVLSLVENQERRQSCMFVPQLSLWSSVSLPLGFWCIQIL